MLKLSLEERKDYIARIAGKVFSQNGYQTASLRDVSREAKISKAGMYHYFKSKEEILAHILIKNTDIFLAKLKSSIEESRKNGLGPSDSFKNLMTTYARHVNSDKERRRIVLRERHQLTGRYKEDLLKREQEIFHLIKNELQDVKNLEKSIDPNVVAFLLISMSHWIGYWFKNREKLSLDEIIDQNIRVIFNGMLKKGKSAEKGAR